MGGLALALGLLTIAGLVQLWHVYIFAFLFGSAAAFDAPVRQTFVAELVGDEDLHNAWEIISQVEGGKVSPPRVLRSERHVYLPCRNGRGKVQFLPVRVHLAGQAKTPERV